MKTSPAKATLSFLLLGIALLSPQASAQDTTGEAGAAVAAEAQVPDTAVTAEEPRIEATVEEIRALINLPPQARLRREIDYDPANPNNFFDSPSKIAAALGERPRFVYIPEGVDPMIIPWVRARVITEELMSEVETLERTGDEKSLTDALELLDRILRQYADETNRGEVDAKRVAVADQLERVRSANTVVSGPEAAPTPVIIEFPSEVRNKTLGVIVDRDNPAESLVLIGGDIQKAGERVRTHPGVLIKEILQDQVIYTFENKDYVVPVQREEGSSL